MPLTGFIKGIDLYKDRKYVESGLKILDEVLGGGLETGLFYMFYGSRRVNEFLYSLIGKTLVSEDTGILIVDCDNWFNPYQLNRRLCSSTLLKKIQVARAFNWEHFKHIISSRLIAASPRSIILIVAGVNTLFLNDVKSKGDYEGFLKVITVLRRIAAADNIVLATYHPNNTPIPHFVTQYPQIHILMDDTGKRLSLTRIKHPSLPTQRVFSQQKIRGKIFLTLDNFKGDYNG